jgi:uncharacterized protein YjeT (DUF2065 family)
MFLMKRRLKHFTAMVLIGDGVLALVRPKHDARAWTGGPALWRRLMKLMQDHPDITRLVGAVQVVGAVAWALAREKERDCSGG